MKRWYSTCAAIVLVCVTSPSQAGFFDGFMSWLRSDQCSGLQGEWSGSGEIDKTFFGKVAVQCFYQGSGEVVVDSSSNTFTLENGSLTRQSSSSTRCPANPPLSFSGSCQNGQLNVNSDMFQMKGNMTSSTNMHLSGTANIEDYKGLVVQNMDLQKK